MAVELVITKKVDLKNPVLIEGFPGLGLVGTISASYMVEKLKMEPLGYIKSDVFPPMAAVHNHIPLHPARIYASKKSNIIVILSEFVIPVSAVFELADRIFDFARQMKVKKIISLGGITIKGEQDTVYAIASNMELVEQLGRYKSVKLIKEGATTGVAGVLLARGADEKFPVISLLAEAQPEYMDPHAGTMVIDVVNEMLGLKIDTSALEQESKLIETKMRDVMNKAKTAQQHYAKTESLGPMYG
ncbi:proteasome assembly chaperone family protein [Candidatus Parvarchaeota archaeon]|nr:proteasome assembly chaperone family protein [Candidatus Parvarchaeota archaeon]